MTKNLRRDGDQIPVTNENRLIYIASVAQHRLAGQPWQQTMAFLRGLSSMIQPSWLSMFNQAELQTLIGGTAASISVADLLRVRRNSRSCSAVFYMASLCTVSSCCAAKDVSNRSGMTLALSMHAMRTWESISQCSRRNCDLYWSVPCERRSCIPPLTRQACCAAAPMALHYGLLIEVAGGSGYSFDKHWAQDFDPGVCPPWRLPPSYNASVRLAGGLFPHPPPASSFTTEARQL